mgnify:CR=1 FL=1
MFPFRLQSIEIVKYMVDKTLSKVCEGKTPSEILNISVADIACGSGIFLEEAFAYLQDYCVQWYISNGQTDHLIETGIDLYKLPLQEKKDILDNNKAIVVEGIVEKYHAMPLEGHDTEHFEINGIYFEYSNFELSNGYNTPACYGGVIKENGQYLKIKYIEDDVRNNIILYIEEIE